MPLSRDFPGGKLGLAWTAVGEDGGVCDTYRLHREVGTGHWAGTPLYNRVFSI